jgi:tetratricopeptide (TPR) repeat protein
MTNKLVQTPLERSLIGDFYKQPEAVNPETARQLGATVSDRAEQIYKQTVTVRDLLSNASANPARFGCSVVALMSGLSGVYSGNLWTGTIATAAGAKELYNLCTTGNTSTLHRLLSDINADVDMIKTLEEGQQQSFRVVEDNLNLIHGDLNTLYGKLDQIKQLSDHGLDSITKGKERATEIGSGAKEAYREALQLFKEAKEVFSSSKKTYKECSWSFEQIQKIAKMEGSHLTAQEKIDALVKVAGEASTHCQKGKYELDAADRLFSQAMEAFAKASNLKDQSIEEISKVIQSAEDTLKANEEKAQYTKESLKRLDTAQKEVQEVKERAKDVMRLLNEMSDDVRKAKNEADKKLDPSDVVVGVGTGIFLSSMGSFTALAVGVTAAYAWHNGTTIADTTKKIHNYFSGKTVPPKQPMGADEVVRVTMDEHSSGYYGSWFKKRGSNTLGTLDVNLPGEVVQFRIDLNQNDYPVSKEDLFTLYKKMFTQLKEGTLSPEGCEKVLNQLHQVKIDRGGLHEPVNGLAKKSQAAHGIVKALTQYCEKLKSAALSKTE